MFEEPLCFLAFSRSVHYLAINYYIICMIGNDWVICTGEIFWYWQFWAWCVQEDYYDLNIHVCWISVIASFRSFEVLLQVSLLRLFSQLQLLPISTPYFCLQKRRGALPLNKASVTWIQESRSSPLILQTHVILLANVKTEQNCLPCRMWCHIILDLHERQKAEVISVVLDALLLVVWSSPFFQVREALRMAQQDWVFL